MDVITCRVEYRSSLFIKTVFEATFSFSNILQITQATLNQIDNIKSFTSDMRFDVVDLTCGIKSLLITAMFNIGTGGAIPVVAPKGTGGGLEVTGVGAVSKLGSNEDVANISTTAISY